MSTKRTISSVAAILMTAGIVRADFTFGPAKNLGPVVNGPAADCCPNVSADGLTLYFSSGRPGGLGDYDIWFCTRPTVDAEWGAPVNIGAPINSIYYDAYPCVSGDGLTLYFSEHWMFNDQVGARLPAGSTSPWNSEIWMSTRASLGAPWGPVVSAGSPPNDGNADLCVAVSHDGLDLAFVAKRTGGQGYTDVYVCSRSTAQQPWGPAVNCGAAVNSYSLESGPCLSADGRAMFFESCRDNAPFVWDLYMTTRQSRADPWRSAVKLPVLINTPASEWNPALSADGRTLYFASDRAGGYGDNDLYEAALVPVVDFNHDAKVDNQDLLRLVASWGQADPSVDIGPFPWGDGKVDFEDMKIFMAEWEKANSPAKP